VEAKVASALRVDARDVAARVVVEQRSGGFHVHIEWSGTTRDFDAPSCAEAADATALIVSLDAEEAAAPVAPSVLPPSAPDVPAPERRMTPSATYAAFARGFFDSGSLAEPALGTTLGVTRVARPLEIALGVGFAAGLGGASDGAGDGGRFDAVSGQLEAFAPFHFGSFAVGPAAGLEAGALFARGTGIDHPASRTNGVVAALAAGRGRLEVTPRIALTVDLGLAVPFDRPSFYFSPSATDFARVAPVAFRGGFGLSVRFP
jgi:hypothetical protein